MAQWTGKALRLGVVLAVLVSSSAAQTEVHTQLLSDVVRMLESKIPEQVIVARIRQMKAKVDLSAEDLIRLKKAGATDAVLLALVESPTEHPSVRTDKEGNGANPTFEPTGLCKEVGVLYRKSGQWTEVLPEVVNWKTGGVLKNLGSAGIVKKDINGNIPGLNSRNSVATPLEFMICAAEGVAITEYQLLRLRPGKDYREFRSITGGVLNSRSGAHRDMVPFEGKKLGPRQFSIILPSNLGAGEYGFLHLGSSGGQGGLTSLSMGKMYTFRVIE
jgi:hypothetical protein